LAYAQPLRGAPDNWRAFYKRPDGTYSSKSGFPTETCAARKVIAAVQAGLFQDLCLWPCEPVLSRGRTRGFVFPYCNAVTTAGIAIADTFNGTTYANDIAERLSANLDQFTNSEAVSCGNRSGGDP
jgi:hypothetical protein